MADSVAHTTEILQHRISWKLADEGAPTELDESSRQHITALIKDGYREGELHVTGEDGETTHRGAWNIDWT